MIFSSIHRNALPYLFEKYIRANPRLILEKIAETDEATLPLYATHFGVPAYDFYTKYYETPIVIDSKTVIYGYWEDDLLVLANGWKRQGIERIWIFDNHTFGEEKLKMDANIQKIGVVEIHFKDVFAEAFLVKLQ